jgi:methylated-DNA-protein-cysteine methyltransferase related protein
MGNTRLRKASRKDKLKASDSFFEKVYEVARKIPFGRVTSYGAIAKHLGSARSARMVGWAMNNSSLAHPTVPAHRVLNRNGMLTGKHHFGSPTMMEQLLANEGIRVEDDCVVDFEKVFWEPKRGRKRKR